MLGNKAFIFGAKEALLISTYKPQDGGEESDSSLQIKASWCRWVFLVRRRRVRHRVVHFITRRRRKRQMNEDMVPITHKSE